jgi:hypothetical protein
VVINPAEMQDSVLEPRYIHKRDTEVDKARDRGKDWLVSRIELSSPRGVRPPLDDPSGIERLL